MEKSECNIFMDRFELGVGISHLVTFGGFSLKIEVVIIRNKWSALRNAVQAMYWFDLFGLNFDQG